MTTIDPEAEKQLFDDMKDKIEVDADVLNQALDGKAEALYQIGTIYYLQASFSRAKKWFLRAAEKDHGEAQFRLGYMHDRGEGTKVNHKLALEWYRKAYENGDIAATNNIGYFYDNGCGVASDQSVALKWFLVAANKGNVTAQYNVGEFYEEGKGCEKNRKKALHWYQRSADQGDEDAKKKVEELSKEMELSERKEVTPEQDSQNKENSIKVEILTKKITDLKAKNTELASRVSFLEHDGLSIRDDKDKLAEENKMLHRQIKTLNERFVKLDAEKKAVDDKLDLLQKENELIHQRLRLFDKEISMVYKLQERMEDLEESASSLVRKRIRLRVDRESDF